MVEPDVELLFFSSTTVINKMEKTVECITILL